MSRLRHQRRGIPQRYSASGATAGSRNNTSRPSGRDIPQTSNVLQRFQQLAIETAELLTRKCRGAGFGVLETLRYTVGR